MAKNLGDEFENITEFIDQLEGARLLDEHGQAYTMKDVRKHPIPWSGDAKTVLFTAEYDHGRIIKTQHLGFAYTEGHKFIQNTLDEQSLAKCTGQDLPSPEEIEEEQNTYLSTRPEDYDGPLADREDDIPRSSRDLRRNRMRQG